MENNIIDFCFNSLFLKKYIGTEQNRNVMKEFLTNPIETNGLQFVLPDFIFDKQ